LVEVGERPGDALAAVEKDGQRAASQVSPAGESVRPELERRRVADLGWKLELAIHAGQRGEYPSRVGGYVDRCAHGIGDHAVGAVSPGELPHLDGPVAHL